MVVDDDTFVSYLMKTLLASDGYEIVTADNGDEALEKIKQTHFDLVLTDWKMDGTDGMAVLAETKRLFPSLPVILLTGHASYELKERALDAGAQNCLAKPCRYEILRSEIEKTLKLSRARCDPF